MFVTFFDTCMVSLVAIFVWQVNPLIVFLPWLTIALLDGAYLSSVLTKVPEGAWFTLALATVLACILLLWRFGKEQQWFAEAEDRFPTSHFLTMTADGKVRLSDRYDGTSLSTAKGLGIFFDKAGETTPMAFSQFVLKLTARPDVIVFFHLRPLEVPSVQAEDRHTISRLAIPNCYRLVVRYGYNDEIITPNLAQVIVDQIRLYLRRQLPPADISDPNMNESQPTTAEKTSSSGVRTGTESNDRDSDSQDHVERLEAAFAHKVLYIIGKEQMKIKEKTGIFRRVILSVFLWIRENTCNKMANLRVPIDKVVEIGFLKEI